jgi:hypothetical protein
VTSTEHALRRPISRYERLSDFLRMRSLVEAAVAAGQTAEQIAQRLNRAGFHPASHPAEPFTPAQARDLAYRLGLSPRHSPAVRLSADEWWARDLADEPGVSYCRFKGWVEKGYVHVRKVGRLRRLVIWADAEERERLGRLRDYLRPGRSSHCPVELTRPKVRSDGEPGSGAKPSRPEDHNRDDR